MNIRVFYSKKDFFGQWQYNIEDVKKIETEKDLNETLRKCLNSFEKTRGFCFRVEGENSTNTMILVERKAEQHIDYYTMTLARAWNNIDPPTEVYKKHLKEYILKLWNEEQRDTAA